MKVFMDNDLLELYKTGKNARYKEVARNIVLMRGFLRAVNAMMIAGSMNELRGISYLHYEQLRHDYSGLSSVRLSNSYVHRLIFRESEEGISIELITIDDTHYGNKR